ncbi:MAG: TetM/TetW/TetO/TetS family tetracycline resistance ribosomal protection protein [Clostridium sp.]
MNKSIGIFAHVDAGKTTFSEQLLFHSKSIRTRGRVDHKEAFLDSHKIEKERGITVFSDIGIFDYKGSKYYLIDTPGHIDFSPEMERAISVLDYAIVIVSAVEGVQGHTETVWKLLRKQHIPTFIFINKVDRVGARVAEVLQELRRSLSEDIILLQSADLNKLTEEEAEFIAERDEELMELYFEVGYDSKTWKDTLKALVKEEKIFISSKGSALEDEGVIEFMETFHELTTTDYESEDKLTARVFKVKYDDKGNRVTFLKILGGGLKVKDEISYDAGEEVVQEKINEIRRYNGTRYQVCDAAVAGEIIGVIGLTGLKAGMGIGVVGETYDMIPTLRAKVMFEEGINPREILKCFKILESEEASLNVTWSEEFQEIYISIMGKIQLEVLKEILLDRFNMKVEFGTPEILYKETMKGQVEGFGHFEPLRHYAEVHLKLEEGLRGFGITFENKCHNDFLTPGNQNLIRTHVFEKEHKGILTGSSITDLKVTLITGRAHNKHTEGGDFREATKRAIRQGLEKAEKVLLEPFYKFRMDVDLSLLGRVMSDIQKMSGIFEEPETFGDRVVVQGKGPVSEFMNYPLEFQAFTKGKGAFSMVFSGYEECHNVAEVIEKIGYKKDADPEYTSSSIFCAKGVGFSVPWNEAEGYMHCLK